MHTGVKDPCWFQSGNVGGVDLVDILVTHVAGIIAVVSPVQVFLLVVLCCAPGYGNAYREQRNCQHPNQCTAIPATYSGAQFFPNKAHSCHRFPRTLSSGRSSKNGKVVPGAKKRRIPYVSRHTWWRLRRIWINCEGDCAFY